MRVPIALTELLIGSKPFAFYPMLTRSNQGCLQETPFWIAGPSFEVSELEDLPKMFEIRRFAESQTVYVRRTVELNTCYMRSHPLLHTILPFQ